MKLNLDQIQKINEAIKFIIEWCDWFAEYEEDLILSKEQIEEIIKEGKDIETIDFCFPGDDSGCIDTEEFLSLSEEIKSIQIVKIIY